MRLLELSILLIMLRNRFLIDKTFNLIPILVKGWLLNCIAILYFFHSSIVLLEGFLDSIFIVPYVVIELILSIDLLLLRHLLVVFVESNV